MWFLWRLLINAAALWVAIRVIDGISFTGDWRLLFAVALVGPAAVVLEWPLALPARPMAWVAAAWLGLLGSCTAYLLYFSLINAWGATRASLVTYVFPVVGLLLGILILDEPTDWRLLAGTALIVVGIVLVNARALRAALPGRAVVERHVT